MFLRIRGLIFQLKWTLKIMINVYLSNNKNENLDTYHIFPSFVKSQFSN